MSVYRTIGPLVCYFPVASYEASLKLDQTYDPALDDPDSTQYRNLKTEVETVVSRCFMSVNT